jgi:hypothetical protein
MYLRKVKQALTYYSSVSETVICGPTVGRGGPPEGPQPYVVHVISYDM